MKNGQKGNLSSFWSTFLISMRMKLIHTYAPIECALHEPNQTVKCSLIRPMLCLFRFIQMMNELPSHIHKQNLKRLCYEKTEFSSQYYYSVEENMKTAQNDEIPIHQNAKMSNS